MKLATDGLMLAFKVGLPLLLAGLDGFGLLVSVFQAVTHIPGDDALLHPQILAVALLIDRRAVDADLRWSATPPTSHLIPGPWRRKLTVTIETLDRNTLVGFILVLAVLRRSLPPAGAAVLLLDGAAAGRG